MDKDTDKDLDKDTDTDKDKDKDTDLEFDLELEFEVEYFSKIYIRRCSPHSVIWITWNTSQRKFQWR
jgi:frataxin-like iron-binding protein CyaY